MHRTEDALPVLAIHVQPPPTAPAGPSAALPAASRVTPTPAGTAATPPRPSVTVTVTADAPRKRPELGTARLFESPARDRATASALASNRAASGLVDWNAVIAMQDKPKQARATVAGSSTNKPAARVEGSSRQDSARRADAAAPEPTLPKLSYTTQDFFKTVAAPLRNQGDQQEERGVGGASTNAASMHLSQLQFHGGQLARQPCGELEEVNAHPGGFLPHSFGEARSISPSKGAGLVRRATRDALRIDAAAVCPAPQAELAPCHPHDPGAARNTAQPTAPVLGFSYAGIRLPGFEHNVLSRTAGAAPDLNMSSQLVSGSSFSPAPAGGAVEDDTFGSVSWAAKVTPDTNECTDYFKSRTHAKKLHVRSRICSSGEHATGNFQLPATEEDARSEAIKRRSRSKEASRMFS